MSYKVVGNYTGEIYFVGTLSECEEYIRYEDGEDSFHIEDSEEQPHYTRNKPSGGVVEGSWQARQGRGYKLIVGLLNKDKI